jgi:hypothetical protein
MITGNNNQADRRAYSRVRLNVDVEWENEHERRRGTMSDLSRAGCFILAPGDFVDGEIVKVFMPLSDGMKVQLTGEVSNHVEEIGFAVRFLEVTPSHVAFLNSMMDKYELDED